MASTTYEMIRRIILGTLVATIIGGAALVFTLAAPLNTTTVTGVATEAARDIYRHPHAPVQYTYNGVERTEFVGGELLAGQTVTFTVTHDGAPTGKSWSLAAFLAGVAALILTLPVVGFWLPIYDAFDRKAARARVAEYNDARLQRVH